ncbi:putative mitochondrial protein, conserved [Tulasnella sp. JGI-2019a]|nr:putative mitochondrial protein, conserved [Tulasnella sp. JGI-2019a]KAG9007100.1 putative mitochondrial protein, conserved [Tulasnella sp. JGI-2019a]KAG9033206.1 putative mitochondrial protein, conserved [Tulasnella sp. JGI-2019a]
MSLIRLMTVSPTLHNLARSSVAGRIITTPSSACIHSASLLRLLPPNLNRPGPPPLPAKDQREFEDLIRKAQAPLSKASGGADHGASQLLDQDVKTFADSENLLLHPDARPRPAPDFLGEENPSTGERGGPKKEPLNWGSEGEWTYGGRATDF